MSAATIIHLVTGFFGSGKTTFLNHAAAQLQGDHIVTVPDDPLFFSDDRALLHTRPGILLVELAGSEDPAVFREKYMVSRARRPSVFGDQYCIVDAAHFIESLALYPVVGMQAASSDIFILNKTDLVPREQVEEIKTIIGKYSPKPYFIEAVFAEVDVLTLFSGRTRSEKKRYAGKPPAACTSVNRGGGKEWAAANRQHQDQLVSLIYRWRGGSIVSIEEMSLVLPHEVVRVKGFLAFEGGDCLYSYVMGHFIIVEQHDPVRDNWKNSLVCTLPAGAISDLEAVMSRYNFQRTGGMLPNCSKVLIRQKNSSIR